MSGILMVAETAVVEGEVTKVLMAVMIGVGLTMGLFLATKITKDWSRG